MKDSSILFEGIRICVLGTAAAAKRIEEACQTSAQSFAEYDPAYLYCKEQKNVGLLLITDPCPGGPFEEVFRELRRPALEQGLPCYGVIIHAGNANAATANGIGKNRPLLDYLPLSELTDTEHAAGAWSRLWALYTRAFEEQVLPLPFQKAILSIAETELGKASVHFLSRVLESYLGFVKVSWYDAVVFRWVSFLEVIAQRCPAMLKNQDELLHFLKVAQDPNYCAHAAIAVIRQLEAARASGRLEAELKRLSGQADAISLYLAQNRNAILRFAEDAQHD